MPRIEAMNKGSVDNILDLYNSGSNSYIESSTGKKFSVFYPYWLKFGSRNFHVKDLPIDQIPEVMYAFLNVDKDGCLTHINSDADYRKRITSEQEGIKPLDSYNSNNNYYGNFGQFNKLKQQGKQFNLIIGVGGWGNSQNFSSVVGKSSSRNNFVKSLSTFLSKYTIFCGIALYWEYLSNDGVNYGAEGNGANKSDVTNLVLLLKQLRAEKDKNFRIYLVCRARPENAKLINFKDIVDLVDEFHLPTYDFTDYSISKDKMTCSHTNLRKSNYTVTSVEEIVEAYIAAGVPPEKIMIGAAFYSTGFSGTDGPGEIATGPTPDKSVENGIVNYKDLPKPGAVEYWDSKTCSPFSYDTNKRIFNSYDNINSIYYKSCYVWEKGLKGMICWEASEDLPVDNQRSLIKALNDFLVTTDPRNLPEPKLPPFWKFPDPPADPWEAGKTYAAGSVVKFNGVDYKCIKDHSDTTPETLSGILWSPIKETTEAPSVPPKDTVDIPSNVSDVKISSVDTEGIKIERMNDPFNFLKVKSVDTSKNEVKSVRFDEGLPSNIAKIIYE